MEVGDRIPVIRLNGSTQDKIPHLQLLAKIEYDDYFKFIVPHSLRSLEEE
jgi:hypothetical protein